VDRLPDALALIKDAKEAELAAEAAGGLQDAEQGLAGERPPSAEDGLKHLMLSANVETLYR